MKNSTINNINVNFFQLKQVYQITYEVLIAIEKRQQHYLGQ
jgi:hypothetical protein